MSAVRRHYNGGRFSQLDRKIPPQWWTQGKRYGSTYGKKSKQARSNLNSRIRRGLDRLERCALERIAHRQAGAAKRRNSVAGQNLAAIAAWAKAHKGNTGKMSTWISNGWALAKANNYVRGQRVDLSPNPRLGF